ncbi:MAG: hypothetical protein GY778_16105, partial [bacterium]|nr:hypothetical protein [bacterium]
MKSSADGRIWALTERGLWEFDGEWQEAVEAGPRWFQAMAIDGRGIVWLASENRIFHWDGLALTERFSGAPQPNHSDPLGTGLWVADLAGGPEDGAWALTMRIEQSTQTVSSEIVHIGAGPAEAYPLPAGFAVNLPGSLILAPDGAVWVAGGPALLRFDGAAWTEFQIPDEAPLNWPGSMAAGSPGEVWIANGKGVLRRATDGWRGLARAAVGLAPAGDRTVAP